MIFGSRLRSSCESDVQCIIGSMRKVVVSQPTWLVLHADDGSDPSGFSDLRGSDEMTHQTLLPEFGWNCHWCLDRPLSGFMAAKHSARVDYIEHIQPQIAEVVVNCRSQLLA